MNRNYGFSFFCNGVFNFFFREGYGWILLTEIRHLSMLEGISRKRYDIYGGYCVPAIPGILGRPLAIPGILVWYKFWGRVFICFSIWKQILKEEVESCRLRIKLGSRLVGKVVTHPFKFLGMRWRCRSHGLATSHTRHFGLIQGLKKTTSLNILIIQNVFFLLEG